MGLGDLFKRRSADNNEVEYYEDTHNEKGEYIGKNKIYEEVSVDSAGNSMLPPTFNTQPTHTFKTLPNKGQPLVSPTYQNVVVYEPRTPEDVQILIDYLKRKEPAIINLDNVEVDVAQRVLDFVSGAIYALNGSVHRVAGNIFLMSPEGVEITVPYEL